MPEKAADNRLFTLKDYLRETFKTRYVPKDEYGHKSHLLAEDTNTPDRERNVARFNLLCSKQVLLSNIGKDRLLRIYQRDVGILTELYDMAIHDPILEDVVEVFYYTWKNELMLTRVKDGFERKAQAKGAMTQNSAGAGDAALTEQVENEEKGLFSRGKKYF
jgi:hypothetical protein